MNIGETISDIAFRHLFDLYEVMLHEGRTQEAEAFEREHGSKTRPDGVPLAELMSTLRKVRAAGKAMTPPPGLTERVMRRIELERGSG